MNKASRWATIVGVVCGAEVITLAVIGGAGVAGILSVEAAIVAVLLGAVSVWIVLDRRRRKQAAGLELNARTNFAKELDGESSINKHVSP